MKYNGPQNQTLPRNLCCGFDWCNNDAVRIICYDSNAYENDKYCWACEECASKHEVK